MTIGTLILGSAALLFTAYCLAACLRLAGVVSFLLAAYVIAFSEVVVVSLLLSPGHWLTQTGLLSTLYGVWFVALLVWWVLGLPKPPPFGPVVRSAREALRDPVLLVLAVALTGALCYLVALIVGTAPNVYDVLWYHLARAAFWKQQHAVAYIAGANDNRLNAFPPNAEIANAFTMILGRTERFVGFVQLAALGATAVAVGGVARRIGFSARQALFGTLLFATLPVVFLQASTALNDLVLASFLACCAYFLLSWSPANAALAALSLGLALGTKLTALIALPVLALVGAFAQPRRRWAGLLGIGLAGIVLGSYWYVYNHEETGSWAGHFATTGDPTNPDAVHSHSFATTVAHIVRLGIDAVDPSGSVGRDWFVYLVAAGLLAGVLAWRCRRREWSWIGLAAGLAALAFVVRPLQHGLLHAYQKVWVELGYRRLAFLGFDKHATHPSPFQSWFGPTGLLLSLGCLGLVVARRREFGRLVLVLALLPLVWIVLQGIVTDYNLFDGRYVVFAVAMAAALWGLLLPLRPVAWAAAAVAVTTLLLSLVHYDEKPSGVNVLGGPAPVSVWDLSRAEVIARSLPAGEKPVLAELERRALSGAVIALRVRREDVSYPFFGERLDRRVVFADRGSPPGADWFVVAPGRASPTGRWRPVVRNRGWRLYRTSASA